MPSLVETIANLMRMKRDDGRKFVLMLGAGCSMSSGVKSTNRIMEELLERYGSEILGPSLADRFDKLWRRSTDPDRRSFLKPLLDCRPSAGYGKLAKLIEAGYFDLAITLNFDVLLERSLDAITFTDHRALVRGEHADDALQRMVDGREPRFKLLKLHGSLESVDQFLFAVEEMDKYPDPIASLVQRITASDIIVCGYSFEDLCVMRTFSEHGGNVVCVNPSGVPRRLQSFMRNRQSTDFAVEMEFDPFFEELHRHLLKAGAPATGELPLPNPFKFLDSYDETDKEAFAGRQDETRDFLRRLGQTPIPRIVLVAGPEKAGKTSLVRAGFLAGLDPTTHEGIYLRCKANPTQTLPLELLAYLGQESPGPTPSLVQAFTAAGETAGERRRVLVLDEFDRIVKHVVQDEDWNTKAGLGLLTAFLREHVFPGCHDRLTLVPVITDDVSPVTAIFNECVNAGLPVSIVQCLPFEGREVADMVRTLAAKGGFEFDERILSEMVQKYEQSRKEKGDSRFTLAHIQAVCHILATQRRVEYDSYKLAFDKNLEALHQAINVHDIMCFVEDFSWPDTVWLRNMIKVPLKENKERIAVFIKSHYRELLPGSRTPDAAARDALRVVG
jgi:SIR2-like domain